MLYVFNISIQLCSKSDDLNHNLKMGGLWGAGGIRSECFRNCVTYLQCKSIGIFDTTQIYS